MDDPGGIPLLKKMVVQALESCTDPDLLDLIYKLLAQETTLALN
jgi:hypothetical protein